MFSFHKPKVYRSSQGCCICKAKSSSSRFTDSKKYEDDFMKCFVLEERRTGEICNACVLLVKRWKKLPIGTDRNWRHVVDARAGPGIKSLTKFKSKNKKKKLKDIQEKIDKVIKKKHVYQKRDREESPASDDLNEEDLDGSESKGSSRAGTPEESCKADIGNEMIAFILDYFKQDLVCCGTIFQGRNGEMMINLKRMNPCSISVARKEDEKMINVLRKSPSPDSVSTSPSHSSASVSPAYSGDLAIESTVTMPAPNLRFYESSSDSGYDESSNQGVSEGKVAKLHSSLSGGCTIKPLNPNPLKSEPISLESSTTTKITLSDLSLAVDNNNEIDASSSNSTIQVSNPLVDLATHAATRQPVTN